MQALQLEHREIMDAIGKASALAAGTKLERLSQEELASRDAEMKEAVNSLGHRVDAHAEREELMLEMVKRVLDK